jgi:hypothetical protein
MVPLTMLVLPIVVSAVFVFVVSAIIHMVMPYHRNNYARVPGEDRVLDALRQSDLHQGDYVVPFASTPKEMADPAYLEKVNRGPVAFVTVLPSGPPSMVKPLVLWFVYTLIASLIAAYIASRALTLGVDYLDIFRFTGTAAFAAYVPGLWQLSIWFGRSWSTTFKSSFDGLVYALVTAGVFGWLWPG